MVSVLNERAWFSEQVTEAAPSMYRLARGILRNDADAEDAVQEAVLKAWENLGSLRDAGKFRPWMMAIVVNSAKQSWRRRGRETYLEDSAEEPSVQPPDIAGKVSLETAVQSLPEDMRAAVILFYFDGMSVSEISCATGDAPGAVKTRLCRARQKLRTLLGEGGLDG